ncbi:MAG: hypothetical protein ACLQPD_17865 [Desulfomonilaceae bacterium]
MNTKQVFIIIVATLFLAVSIVGAQAGTTVKGSKSNSDNIVATPSTSNTSSPSPSDATTVKSSKSNSSFRKAVKDPNKVDPAEAITAQSSETGSTASFKGKGKNPKTDSINLNSSRSN